MAVRINEDFGEIACIVIDCIRIIANWATGTQASSIQATGHAAPHIRAEPVPKKINYPSIPDIRRIHLPKRADMIDIAKWAQKRLDSLDDCMRVAAMAGREWRDDNRLLSYPIMKLQPRLPIRIDCDCILCPMSGCRRTWFLYFTPPGRLT